MHRLWISAAKSGVARLARVAGTCILAVGLLLDATAQNVAETPAVDSPLALPEAQIEFRRLIREEDYGAAVAIGERLLELSLAEFGTQSTQTAKALYELGDVQRRAGMYEEAETSFLNAIEIFRAVDGTFSALTIEPSIGLGDTYLEDGQYMNAVAAYNEARTIQRRAFGLLTEDQLTVMDRMTTAFQSLSMNEEADEQQRNAVALVERIHGSADVETLEAMYKYGAWLRSVYRFEAEREQYERALRIIRSEYDKDHPLLVKPYREIGNSWRVQGFESPRGFSALNSAREILEMQENPDPLELAAAIIDVGDWRTAFQPAGSGHEDYLVAWNLLGSTPRHREARAELFQPRRAQAVYAQGMSIRGLAQNPNDPDSMGGQVLLQFDIDPYGRTQNVSIIESDPPGFKDDAAARSVRQSRFRPRIVDGQFVTARRQGYRISFRYIPDE
jgi:TonB family protein